MVFLSGDLKATRPIARFLNTGTVPKWADLVAFLLLAACAVLVVRGAEDMSQPLAALHATPVTLDPARLPEYALRTTLRMFLALGASLIFTFTVATLAAKSRKAELLIVPALDILQSVPVLGFLTFTVTFFMGLFPGRQLGVECAAIFAIFTSQAWNMAFSSEVQRGARLELPFATPSLVWNVMMSMSGGWFFVVASEAITVGDTTVTLPGIGSWLSVAIARQDMKAVAVGVGAMAVIIVLYDQLVFRPVVAWADKFRFEQTASQQRPASWLYDLLRRAAWTRSLSQTLAKPLASLSRATAGLPPVRLPMMRLPKPHPALGRVMDLLWLTLVAVTLAGGVWLLWSFLSARLTFGDVGEVSLLGLATLLRVVVLIALASLIWVPIGVWIGLRPAWAERLQPIAQFLAAFPANVMFPFAVATIVALRLNPNIWLSPLMVFGTQWYILFNVIAGASAIPSDLKEAAGMFGLKGWQWWRQVAIPGIFPYYVTGALTASGGSWNASIVAEAVSWGHEHLEAAGLGSYIAKATAAGDSARVALGVAVMSVFVIAFNRTLWRPMYRYAERRLRLA